MSNEQIGQALKDARTSARRSPEWMADQLEVTSKTIANWETGRTKAMRAVVLAYQQLTGRHIDVDLRDQDKPTSGWEAEIVSLAAYVERRRNRRTSRRRTQILLRSSNQAGPFDLSRKAA